MADTFPDSHWPRTIDGDVLASLDGPALHAVYGACRDNIAAENMLVSYRLTWALTLSGGFLTAEAFMMSAIFNRAGPITPAVEWVSALAAVLSTIAAWFCSRSRLGVAAALDQIEFTRQWANGIAPACSRRGLPRPHGSRLSFERGHRTAEMITTVLFTLWALLGVSESTWFVYLLTRTPPGDEEVVGALVVVVLAGGRYWCLLDQ